MNALYNHGIKQTQLITKDLAAFEKQLSTAPLSLQGSIGSSLTSFKKTIREYRDLVRQNSQDETNTKHETRLNRFEGDLEGFQKKFDILKKQRETMMAETSRQELMGRRHTAQGLVSENPYDPSRQQSQTQQQLSYLEGLDKERGSLQRGTQQLDHILDMGLQALQDLVDQNDTLHSMQIKFEHGLEVLGVSRGTIRSIERRARQDKWLFWGSFFLLVVFFWYVSRRFG